ISPLDVKSDCPAILNKHCLLRMTGGTLKFSAELPAACRQLRDLRFDNVPSGWSGSSTERFSGWDIIPTQVP
ncbi:MAG: hypothetical protein EWV58_17540, partial [Microcystis aeruginosa Ma_MB_F_20061100_S19]